MLCVLHLDKQNQTTPYQAARGHWLRGPVVSKCAATIQFRHCPCTSHLLACPIDRLVAAGAVAAGAVDASIDVGGAQA